MNFLEAWGHEFSLRSGDTTLLLWSNPPASIAADPDRILFVSFILASLYMGAGTAKAVDVRQTCTVLEKKTYLHAKWTTRGNLTSDERKHEILRDLLTDQQNRGGKKITWKLKGLLVWQCAMNVALIQVFLFLRPQVPSYHLAAKWSGDVRMLEMFNKLLVEPRLQRYVHFESSLRVKQRSQMQILLLLLF